MSAGREPHQSLRDHGGLPRGWVSEDVASNEDQPVEVLVEGEEGGVQRGWGLQAGGSKGIELQEVGVEGQRQGWRYIMFPWQPFLFCPPYLREFDHPASD